MTKQSAIYLLYIRASRKWMYFAEENGIYSLPILLPPFFFVSSSVSYYGTFRGPIAAISLAPSARSGRVHAHVKGVVQQAGLKRQVA